MRNLGEASETLQPGSNATPMSTLIWAVASGDLATVEAQLDENIEWHQMPYNTKVVGKKEVMSWLHAGSKGDKKPEVFNNTMISDWGVFEYWNVGTATKETIEFGKSHGWPFPREPESLIGQEYRVAQCFVFHINASGRIDLMRQYLDAGSIWAQFK